MQGSSSASLKRKREFAFESTDDLISSLARGAAAATTATTAPTEVNSGGLVPVKSSLSSLSTSSSSSYSSIPASASAPNNANLSNPNMLIKTQVMGTTMVNPLDISDVTDERDRKRLERIDYLFCSLSDDLPLIIKHKVRSILNSHYLVRYDWDDNVYILPLRKLMERLNVEYVRDIGVCKQGLLIHVWKTEELERQDLAPLRKKARYDPPSNGAGDGGVASGGGSGSGSSVHGAD